jgi:hypothetical protein
LEQIYTTITEGQALWLRPGRDIYREKAEAEAVPEDWPRCARKSSEGLTLTIISVL